MTAAVTADRPVPTTPPAAAGASRPGFGNVLRAEWIKFWSVRSTAWSVATLFVLGAGLTVLVCATSAEWLAGDEADESPASFVTWGLMLAQVTAVVLGTLVATSEYGTGMIRATLAAVPRRGPVLAAKAAVLTSTLLVAGTVTAFAGYLGGNAFLSAEGIGLSLDDDGVLRALVGSGLYLAGLGLLSMAVGLLVRHTAAALATVLGIVFVVGNMAFLLPGGWGEWVAKVLPGNAGSAVATPVSFNPELLDPWPGFAVFAVEVAVLLAVATVAFRRRDA
ncbi:ABC transporter permease [Trujillonella endophytica]|uniref:ABC-2 type transport system permease protein n=1 Tax=Trujillonella endophytica TaxID=673521 RepID=A0A1H8UND6_9ACTN|nr:ABC transporter permease [Trujillella endophytica]SEP04414.1 ABC-2 type transport system permease protein [Trujillella endophytica]